MAPYGLNMPPAECPNDSVCLSIVPKLREIDGHISRLDGHVAELRRDVNAITIETHDATTLMKEREGGAKWLRGVAASLVLLGISNLASVAWWASRTDHALSVVVENQADMESRLRQAEKADAQFHGVQYQK